MATTSIQRNRKSNRLKGYDYNLAGAYFITLVAYQHQCLFGEILNGKVVLNSLGWIGYKQWQHLGERFPNSDFSTFVIMPNHVHGIVHLWGAGGFDQEVADQHSPLRPYCCVGVKPGSLGAIVRAYKSSVSFRVNAMRGNRDMPIWQRNYYDHIIRNEQEFENIWKYIKGNPDKWDEDRFHPSVTARK